MKKTDDLAAELAQNVSTLEELNTMMRTRVQLCTVHLVQAALKYVTDADSREVIRDLRSIYPAATVQRCGRHTWPVSRT